MKHSGFAVEMLLGSHAMATSGDAEAHVLAALEFGDGGGGGVRKSYRGGEIDAGADELLVGVDQSFSVLSPGGASESLDHLGPLDGTLGHSSSVRRECEERIESDPEYTRVSLKGDEDAVDKNLRMVVKLVRVWREKRDRRFSWGDFEVDGREPGRDDDKVAVESRLGRGDVGGLVVDG